MDQKMIEEGLKRLQRAVEKEELEKKIKEQTEAPKQPIEAVNEDGILTEEEEEKQNEALRSNYPNDICPVCQTHVVDARYLVIATMGAVVCGICQSIFMPKSRYDEAVKMMEQRRRAKESNIIVPKNAVVPKITI